LSNPSILDLSAVIASLEVFHMTSMSELRKKSVALTNYLETLLLNVPDQCFTIITPRSPVERGAQLSIRLQTGLLDTVLEELESNGMVVDERKPDVIRVAPAPLYNSFSDVWSFVQIFSDSCRKALQRQS
jgi:kynureninase